MTAKKKPARNSSGGKKKVRETSAEAGTAFGQAGLPEEIAAERNRIAAMIREEKKSTGQIINEYGSVAMCGAEASLIAQCSYFNPSTQVFTEALCPLRKIDPAFNAQIDRWLRLLAGTKAEKLLDWLATLPEVANATSILMLTGPPGAGKGMLAAGCARLWSEGGPSPMEGILGNFNAILSKCPLVFADEGIPKPAHGKSGTEELRRLFSGGTFNLNRKRIAEIPVRGVPRCIIAANNPNVLALGEDQSGDDAEAVGARIFHVPIPSRMVTNAYGAIVNLSEAGEFLDEIGGRETTDQWVAGDGIAAHIHWLAKHRSVVRGKRFLVEDDSRAIVSRIATMNGTAAELCEYIAKAILDESAWSNPSHFVHGFILRRDGNVFVSTQLFTDTERWSAYVARKNSQPSGTRAGTALGTLSHSDNVQHRGFSVAPTRRFHRIKLERIAEWCEATGFADPARIHEWANYCNSGYSQRTNTNPSDNPDPVSSPVADDLNDSEWLLSNLPTYQHSGESNRKKESSGDGYSSGPEMGSHDGEPTRQKDISKQPGRWVESDATPENDDGNGPPGSSDEPDTDPAGDPSNPVDPTARRRVIEL
jgi:hypothetical protein